MFCKISENGEKCKETRKKITFKKLETEFKSYKNNQTNQLFKFFALILINQSID